MSPFTNEYGLYIHIPWCVKKCPYCDFNSHEKRDNTGDEEQLYVTSLIKDLAMEAPRVKGRRLSSIFFGGGTPSLFSAKSIDTILSSVRQHLELTENCEITLEANPGTAEANKFHGFFEAGVNRLSIGVQSFNNEQLAKLGRIHNSDQAHHAIQLAKTAGFKRINLDLMFGLPQQTTEQALFDINAALAYNTGHLSHYQLTLEKNTLFYRQPPTLPNDDKLWEIQTVCQAAINTSLQQYEISAYAAAKQQAKHNINYWQFGDYLGIGAGAHGKLTNENSIITRRWKTKHPRQYIQSAGNPVCIGGENTLNSTELPFEFMMNALRLKTGFTQAMFEQQTGLPINSVEELIQQLIEKKLLETHREYTRCTELGWNFLNETLEHFLPK
jgi:oxygen-independent coproporphyrinogen-3 oxidase